MFCSRFVFPLLEGTKMCGRCGCTFIPATLSRACQYKDSSSGKYHQPQWVPSKVDDIQYNPSYNMGPRSVLPILTSGSHVNSNNERIICPMLWGMIPPWHQGDYRKHKMSTHNARLEDLQNSKMYLPPLRQGKRCIAVVEGFYEWKRDGSTKQPYYIYAKQDEDIKVQEKSSWSDDWSEEIGWKGLKLLKLAGIFNTFKTGTGDIVHSFSMLTREANNVLSWLHHRTPVFLTTEEEVQTWLSYKDTPMEKALEYLRRLSLKEDIVNWHPVSTAVNSVFYQSEDCIRPINLEQTEKKKRPTGLMASWLKGASNKRKADDHDSDNSENNQENESAKRQSEQCFS